MDIRRGKYWEPNPERLKKAEEKRERRRVRNQKRNLAERWRERFPFTYRFQGNLLRVRRLSDLK